MRVNRSVLVCSVLLISGAAVRGQTTGTIVGTVTDSSGAVAPNVAITVTSQDTGLTRKTVSSQSGNYAVPLLPVGTYSVTAEAAGFKKKTTTGIVLEVNQEPRVDIALEVGAITDAVTVNSEAPVLQTESAVVGQVVDAATPRRFHSTGGISPSCCCSRQEPLRARAAST